MQILVSDQIEPRLPAIHWELRPYLLTTKVPRHALLSGGVKAKFRPSSSGSELWV